MLANPGKYLTFKLGAEEYGLPIQQVKQIIGMMAITSVPDVPEYIKGIINLRGKIIPVADLRLKFAMPAKAYTDRTCIIVVEQSDKGQDLVGLVVDAVADVATLTEEQIDPPPRVTGVVKSGAVVGVGKAKDKVLLLVNVNRLLDPSDADTEHWVKGEDILNAKEY